MALATVTVNCYSYSASNLRLPTFHLHAHMADENSKQSVGESRQAKYRERVGGNGLPPSFCHPPRVLRLTCTKIRSSRLRFNCNFAFAHFFLATLIFVFCLLQLELEYHRCNYRYYRYFLNRQYRYFHFKAVFKDEKSIIDPFKT